MYRLQASCFSFRVALCCYWVSLAFAERFQSLNFSSLLYSTVLYKYKFFKLLYFFIYSTTHQIYIFVNINLRRTTKKFTFLRHIIETIDMQEKKLILKQYIFAISFSFLLLLTAVLIAFGNCDSVFFLYIFIFYNEKL